MAKRGKSKSGSWRRRGEFLAGIAVGLALALWAYPALKQWWTAPSSQAAASGPSSPPDFTFYDLLEQGEEVVEETLAAARQIAGGSGAGAAAEQSPETFAAAGPATPEQPQPPPPAQPLAAASPDTGPELPASLPVATPGNYALQMGAFTRESEAEALRARLALVGVNASIQPVSKDGQTYYRVRTRPTSDLARLNANRAQLQEHRFDYIRLRLAE